MSLEAVTQMAKATKKPEKAGKSEEELRAVLKQRLDSLKPDLQEGIKEYEQALKDGLFEDANGEPEGSGEARKEALQRKLTALADRAEKIKDRLDSKEELSEAMPEVSTTYTHPDGKKETITLDIEAKLQDFISFYQKTNIDLPPDFEDTIHDIWDRNQIEIEQAIEQNGFDDMLIIPGNIPLADLAEKMKMENGYYFYQVKDDFSNVVSQNVDIPRIILFHHTDSLPKINKKTGLDVHLNITGADAQKLYQANPENYLSTLEDAIILERKYFEETGKHLSAYTTNSAQWLPGSKAGARLVYSYWGPGSRELVVSADDLTSLDDWLGVRPSRCFK
jgi:flagellar hook-basal body complex protein FliE